MSFVQSPLFRMLSSTGRRVIDQHSSSLIPMSTAGRQFGTTGLLVPFAGSSSWLARGTLCPHRRISHPSSIPRLFSDSKDDDFSQGKSPPKKRESLKLEPRSSVSWARQWDRLLQADVVQRTPTKQERYQQEQIYQFQQQRQQQPERRQQQQAQRRAAAAAADETTEEWQRHRQTIQEHHEQLFSSPPVFAPSSLLFDETVQPMYADSVLRKRRRKMNKHKYKKRRWRQRMERKKYK